MSNPESITITVPHPSLCLDFKKTPRKNPNTPGHRRYVSSCRATPTLKKDQINNDFLLKSEKLMKQNIIPEQPSEYTLNSNVLHNTNEQNNKEMYLSPQTLKPKTCFPGNLFAKSPLSTPQVPINPNLLNSQRILLQSAQSKNQLSLYEMLYLKQLVYFLQITNYKEIWKK